MLDELPEEEYEAYVKWEQQQGGGYVFYRSETRHRLRKTLGDCGHWIDGSLRRLTPYIYSVWKVAGEDRIQQRIECEDCALRRERERT